MIPNPRRPDAPPDLVEAASDRNLIASLNSTTCPACGGTKQRAHTFCPRDYHALSPENKKAIWRKFGEGYNAAFIRCMRNLGAGRIRMPRVPDEREIKRTIPRPRHVTPQIAAWVVASNVCPRCGDEKSRGVVFCRPCGYRWLDALAQMSRQGADKASLFAEKREDIERDLEPARLLAGDEAARLFCVALGQAIRATHGTDLWYVEPTNAKP